MDPQLKRLVINDFSGGLNNRMSPYLMAPNEGRDLQNVMLSSDSSGEGRGVLSKSWGMTDLNRGWSTDWSGTYGMKWVSQTSAFRAIFKEDSNPGGFSTFYYCNPLTNAWRVEGYWKVNDTATIAGGALTTVTDADAGDFRDYVKVGDYFIVDEDVAANPTYWARISAIPDANTLTLAANYGGGAKTDKAYTIKIALDNVNYNVFENPTVLDVSYWHSPEATTDNVVYKWTESSTKGKITQITDTDCPATPRAVLAFKNRLFAVGTGSGVDIASKVTCYWKFNDGAGTTATDTMGLNNLTGVDTPTWAAAKLGANSTELNGTSEYWKSNWSANLVGDNFGGSFTWSAWLWCDGYTSERCIFSNESTAASLDDFFYKVYIKTDGTVRWDSGAAPSTPPVTMTTTATFPTGAWVFFWVRRDGAYISMGWTPASSSVFDTTPKATTTCGGYMGAGTYVFGVGVRALYNWDTATQGYSWFWDGKIDNIVWCKGYSLTNSELAFMFNAGAGTENLASSAAGYPLRVFMSALGDYDSWGANSYFDIQAGLKDQQMSTITSYYDTLVVGLPNEIWTVTGLDTLEDVITAVPNLNIQKTNSSIGMKAYSDSAVVAGQMFFQGYDGQVWAFNGNTSSQIGEKLLLSESVGAQTMVSYNGDLWGVHGAGVYRFDMTRGAWLHYDWDVNCIFTDGAYLYGGSSTDGIIYKLFDAGTYGANGTTSNAYWTSPWYDLGYPEYDKEVEGVWLFGDGVGTPVVDVYFDGSSTASVTSSAQTMTNYGGNLVPVRWSGNWFSFKISDTSSDSWKLRSAVVNYKLKLHK